MLTRRRRVVYRSRVVARDNVGSDSQVVLKAKLVFPIERYAAKQRWSRMQNGRCGPVQTAWPPAAAIFGPS
jgi:hypothetical protein